MKILNLGGWLEDKRCSGGCELQMEAAYERVTACERYFAMGKGIPVENDEEEIVSCKFKVQSRGKWGEGEGSTVSARV